MPRGRAGTLGWQWDPGVAGGPRGGRGRTGAASSLPGRLVGSAISLLCIIRGGGSQWLITAWRTLCSSKPPGLFPAPSSGLWRGDTSPAPSSLDLMLHPGSPALRCSSCCPPGRALSFPGLRRRGRCPARVAAPMEGWLWLCPTWAASPGPRAAPFQVRGFPRQCSDPHAVLGVLVVQPLGRVCCRQRSWLCSSKSCNSWSLFLLLSFLGRQSC